MRIRRLAASLAATSLALLALAAGSGEARAQGKTTVPDRVPTTNGTGMDLHLYRPAVDSKGFFSVNGADILGGGDISLGLILDYGHGIMPLNPGHGSDFMVDHAFKGTVQFDYGIADILVVGASVPIVLNDGGGVTGIGAIGQKTYDTDSLNATAVGDLALHVKVPILRPNKAIGIAVVAQAGGGIGQTRNLASEPGFFYWPKLVLEEQIGRVRLGLEGGFRGHTGENPSFGLGRDKKPQLSSGLFQYANLATAGFAVGVRPVPVMELAAETYGTYEVGGQSEAKQRLSAEAIGGIKLFIERNSYFMLAGGAGYTRGFQSAQERAVVSFIFEPSLSDKPKKEPEPEIEVIRQPVDGDRDGDGILDSRDKCPDEPEDRDGFEDADGCPDPDNDKDGIPDVVDKCPNDPEDFDGFEDKDGCPELDNDGDGIPDAADRCPNMKEIFNGFEDADGCPDSGRVILQDNNIIILDKILFKTGSAEILPESFPIVNAVADTLIHHPEFTLVEVGGHADARGLPKVNVKLTHDRSISVVDALVKKGIERSRLQPQGYGSYCPVEAARTPAAYEKNRRVEFKILKGPGGPTGVPLGCDEAKKNGISAPAVQ